LDASSSLPGTFAYNPTAGNVVNAGTNQLSVVFTPTDVADMNTVTTTVSLVVPPAPLTVTANDALRPSGQANPVFTGTIVGLLKNDNITANFS
jgi:hypothetical protein